MTQCTVVALFLSLLFGHAQYLVAAGHSSRDDSGSFNEAKHIFNLLHSAHGVEEYFQVVYSVTGPVCWKINVVDQDLFTHLSSACFILIRVFVDLDQEMDIHVPL